MMVWSDPGYQYPDRIRKGEIGVREFISYHKCACFYYKYACFRSKGGAR